MADTRYTEAVGRRKTASARVRITSAKTTSLKVNDRDGHAYFPLASMIDDALAPFKVIPGSYSVSAVVKGGGHKAQVDAIRMGIARALVEIDVAARKDLKQKGYLKRDPRAKERKKFGLKAARRAPQWSKR